MAYDFSYNYITIFLYARVQFVWFFSYSNVLGTLDLL